MKCNLTWLIVPIIIFVIVTSFIPVQGITSDISNNPQTIHEEEYKVLLPAIFGGSGEVTETVGGVEITVSSPVMPSALISSEANDAIQVASSTSYDTFEELSINSIAYGKTSPLENLPAATAGGENIYRQLLADFRESQGGTPTLGPAANLFGQAINSSYSIVSLELTSEGERPYLVIEWVVDAFGNMWVVRISKDTRDILNVEDFLSSLQNLVIRGDYLSQENIEENKANVNEVNLSPIQQTSQALSEPEWWKDDEGVWWECDSQNYLDSTGLQSSPLEYSYEGLLACGPLPYQTTDTWVSFYDGDVFGALEWQCVELARRYLYLKYGVEPYRGYGKDVVSNFPLNSYGGFEIVWNNEASSENAPKAGDVISFVGSSSAGHVAVVTNSNIDSEGKGYIEIIEQNAAANGHNVIDVKNWQVIGYNSAINWLHHNDAPEGMIYIPAGEFLMGCDPEHNGGFDCEASELPLHAVYLSSYYIDKYEVTNAQYLECIQSGHCDPPTNSKINNPIYADHPVTYVEWTNASQYCFWVGKRLPTEAEWEKAARGTTPQAYPWGDDAPNCIIVNSVDNTSGIYCIGNTAPIGSYPDGASPYGVMDMAGNVWEWVNDIYDASYYLISPYINPTGPLFSTGNRIIRGGGFESGWGYLRTSVRSAWYEYMPYYSRDDLGFRCAIDAP